MATTFSATIAQWAHDVEEAAMAIVQGAAQDVVAEAQRAGPSVASTKAAISKGLGASGRGKSRRQIQGPVPAAGEGGRMPVDTGFLRASLRASTSSMPQIISSAVPKDGKKYDFTADDVNLIILGMEKGQTLYFGYTAAYAAAMEFGSGGSPPYAFLRTAAQKWPEFVEARAAELKGRFKI